MAWGRGRTGSLERHKAVRRGTPARQLRLTRASVPCSAWLCVSVISSSCRQLAAWRHGSGVVGGVGAAAREQAVRVRGAGCASAARACVPPRRRALAAEAVRKRCVPPLPRSRKKMSGNEAHSHSDVTADPTHACLAQTRCRLRTQPRAVRPSPLPSWTTALAAAAAPVASSRRPPAS